MKYERIKRIVAELYNEYPTLGKESDIDHDDLKIAFEDVDVASLSDEELRSRLEKILAFDALEGLLADVDTDMDSFSF